MADGRRIVTNRSGLEVPVDIGRDMDEATFNRMVASGDLTPVEQTKATAKPSSKK
jgi:hypothetical protein